MKPRWAIEVTKNDIDRPVYSTDGTGEKQFGKIKSFNAAWVFVVYNCADDWDHYQDYTGTATDRKDLEFIPEED